MPISQLKLLPTETKHKSNMRFTATQRILGFLLMTFSLTLIPSMIISIWDQDDTLLAFVVAFAVMLGTGFICWFTARHAARELLLRDGFMITALYWIVLSLVSALPFFFGLHLNFAQAVFEAVSGFTTTGATVFSSGLDNLPRSILYYRSQLHFFGGIGVIVFAVAVLPMLGIGGMQIYRAEAAGPMHEDKLMPRIKHTASISLYVYVILNIGCAVAYWWAGMNLFDAITHSYATVATGGFSTHDASIGYFNSPFIETIAIVFMMLGSLNITIHFVAWRKLQLWHYWQDLQGRAFALITLTLTTIVTLTLLLKGVYTNFWEALRYGSFQLVSIITTTGFLTADFSTWPSFLPILIFGSGFIGGCVGSTAGGFRVIRLILLHKQAVRGIMRLIHPNATIVLKIGRKRVSDDIAETVWEFTVLYVGSYVFLSILFIAVTDIDIVSGFTAVGTCLNMVGPGLGSVVYHVGNINDVGLWVLSFTMLLGRLEIFTLLVILTPAFWKN